MREYTNANPIVSKAAFSASNTVVSSYPDHGCRQMIQGTKRPGAVSDRMISSGTMPRCSTCGNPGNCAYFEACDALSAATLIE